MRIYLENSALNRIFDDQSQPRIFMEANAMEVFFLMVENGSVQLLSSEVVAFENSQSPYAERKAFGNRIIALAVARQLITTDIRVRARQIANMGCKAVDALHVACAEHLAADAFLTCDDGILKRYRGSMKIMGPVDFVTRMTHGGKL